MANPTHLICSGCLRALPPTKFRKHPKGGYFSFCRDCIKAKQDGPKPAVVAGDKVFTHDAVIVLLLLTRWQAMTIDTDPVARRDLSTPDTAMVQRGIGLFCRIFGVPLPQRASDLNAASDRLIPPEVRERSLSDGLLPWVPQLGSIGATAGAMAESFSLSHVGFDGTSPRLDLVAVREFVTNLLAAFVVEDTDDHPSSS